jgi:predicted Zn-dependent protease with MMP-like domain
MRPLRLAVLALGFAAAVIVAAALLGAAVFETIAGAGAAWGRIPAAMLLVAAAVLGARAARRHRPAVAAPAPADESPGTIGFAGVPDPELETLAARAVAAIPQQFREQISNLAFVIEEEPPPGRPWLAIYQGIPLTQKTVWRSWEWPNRITLYRGPIRRAYGYDPQLLAEEVGRIVRHELAHYFGISDERLVELGAY